MFGAPNRFNDSDWNATCAWVLSSGGVRAIACGGDLGPRKEASLA